MDLNRRIVESYLKLYNDKNISSMMTLFAEDVVFESISNSGESTKTNSKKELEELAQSSLQFFVERNQTPQNWVVDSEGAAVEIIYEAVLAKDLSKELKAGMKIKIRGASFFTIENGLITKLVDYM